MLSDTQKTTLKLFGFTVRPGTMFDWVIRDANDQIIALYDPTPNRVWHIGNTEYKQTLKEILNEKFPLGDN
jgi:hypothetical protein